MKIMPKLQPYQKAFLKSIKDGDRFVIIEFPRRVGRRYFQEWVKELKENKNDAGADTINRSTRTQGKQ